MKIEKIYIDKLHSMALNTQMLQLSLFQIRLLQKGNKIEKVINLVEIINVKRKSYERIKPYKNI